MWCKLIIEDFGTSFVVPDWRLTEGHRLTCRWLLLHGEVPHCAPQPRSSLSGTPSRNSSHLLYR